MHVKSKLKSVYLSEMVYAHGEHTKWKILTFSRLVDVWLAEYYSIMKKPSDVGNDDDDFKQ